MPKTGPIDGSRRHSITSLPIFPMPCASEIDVVVFPSPAFVGVIAVVMTSLPSGRSASRSRIERDTLALERPYCSSSLSRIPASAATSVIGRSTASCAICSPLFTASPPVGALGSLRSREDTRSVLGACLADHGAHGGRGVLIDGGWGTYGFKATPIVGVTMAELVNENQVPDLIAPFALERFRKRELVSEIAA